MMALLSMMLVAAPVQGGSLDISSSLVRLFQLTDEYRQCLILDKTGITGPRDTYFAEGGTSAENLDLGLADGQDRLLKRLIQLGKEDEIIKALQQVKFVKVDEKKCKDFDPYYSPAREYVDNLGRVVGIDVRRSQTRWRPQRPERPY